jgi:flagellar hook-basal body complex protein FliE
MAVDPVAFLPPVREIQAEAAPAAVDFGPWLARSLGRVNQDLVHADEAVRGLAAGETENLHQVMIALEEARVSLQLAVQVRNRLLDAYQEVLRMQV